MSKRNLMKELLDKELLERAYQEKMLPLILASLISSDSLTDADKCKKSLDVLYKLQEVFPTTNIPEEKWKRYVEDGICICKRDLNNFQLELENTEFDYGHNVDYKKYDDDFTYEI